MNSRMQWKGMVGAALVLVVSALPEWAGAAIVYTEDFDADHTANWTVNKGPTPAGQDANFFYDYGTNMGIPSAPNSAGGTTLGLRLRANLPGNTATFSGLSVSPTGISVTGSYELRCDAWLNYNGPLNGGGTGSTQCTGWGILTNGTVAQWAGGTQNSLWFAMTGDGGSSVDYRAYSPAAGVGYPDASPVFAAGPHAGNRNGTDPYYSALGGLSAPAAQVTLFPGQTGSTAVGAAGFKWWRVIVKKAGDSVTWTIKDPGSAFELLIATVDSSTFTSSGGNILLNHFDINATQTLAGNDAELLFGLIDNIEVDQLQPPPSITDQPDDVVVNVGDGANFTVVATPGIGNPLHYAWSKTLNAVTTSVGTDSPTHSLTNIPYSDDGATFKVVVSEDSNPNTVTSRSAVLAVLRAPCANPFVNADLDAAGDGDLNDFALLQLCYTGSGGAGFDAALCYCFDRDLDNDVDDADFQAFAACAFGSTITVPPTCDDFPTGDVIINEYAYDMFTAAGGDAADNREFVELYNKGATPVDISGWTLRASDEVAMISVHVTDDNPDYKIPGAPGSGTTVLGAGAFYVIGNASVTNVNQTPGTGIDLWENGRDAIELLDGNGTVKDTVIYERNQGTVFIGEGEGNYWGNHVSVDNGVYQSLSRWTDGGDTNVNGYDFGVVPQTPGASNHASRTVIGAYVPPDVNTATIGDPVAGASDGFNGSFKNARVIDPTVQTSGTAPAGLNPNAIGASPQGGYCIIAWDEAGGGNAVYSNGIMTGDASFEMWVYLDTSPITVPGAESTSYGIMGSTDPLYNLPDPTGNFFNNATPTANGNTGFAWVFQKDNANNHRHLVFVDAKNGGDSSPVGGSDWVIVQDLDMSTFASDWYKLSIQYTTATGDVVARFRDKTTGNDLTTGGVPINYASGRTGLVGGLYVGYRESQAGQPLTLRPPTFD